jgi:hypothetical protein
MAYKGVLPKKLPFRVRKTSPEIIHVKKDTEVPESVKHDRLGSAAMVHRGKIYKFKSKLPKWVIEHEISHTQIPNDKTKSPLSSTAWINDEIAADLLTYQKTGYPKSIKEFINSRAMDMFYIHLGNNAGGKYNKYEIREHVVWHMKKAYQKFWDYLPEQWKKDVNDFFKRYDIWHEKYLSRGEHLRPAGDFALTRSKTGDYKIHKRRVVRQRDEMTGFVMRKPIGRVQTFK